MMPIRGRTAVMLLVEDDLGDQELTRRALEDSPVPSELHIVRNGEEALAYLFRRGQYENPSTSPRPDLVLLDLNLPKLDGHQVLKQIRQDTELRSMAVVVLTTSCHQEDILRTYELGANSYITKPLAFVDYRQAMHALGTYWFRIAELPVHRG